MRLSTLKYTVIVLSMACTFTNVQGQVGRRFAPEAKQFRDTVTGARINALTTSPANDSKLYQTHPQFSSDGKYVVFRSNRNGDRQQAYAVDIALGDIFQLTDGLVNTGSLNVARLSNRLYFMRGEGAGTRQLVELEMGRLIADSKANRLALPATYERIVAVVPDTLRESGGFTLDANEKKAYMGITLAKDFPVGKIDTAEMRRKTGVAIPQHPGGIVSIDLATGKIDRILATPFTMGHVQANPWVEGEILFCNETGGDAPQRMWMANAQTGQYQPLYVEWPDEWVTHEVFVDRDHVLFNVMAHLPRLKTKPSGVFCINVRNNYVTVLDQNFEGNSYWHCGGIDDGQWAVADDFNGNVWLINRAKGGRQLVTTGHLMKPDHTHPNFSPDKKHLLIQSGMLSGGKSLDLMLVELPKQRAVRK